MTVRGRMGPSASPLSLAQSRSPPWAGSTPPRGTTTRRTRGSWRAAVWAGGRRFATSARAVTMKTRMGRSAALLASVMLSNLKKKTNFFPEENEKNVRRGREGFVIGTHHSPCIPLGARRAGRSPAPSLPATSPAPAGSPPRSTACARTAGRCFRAEAAGASDASRPWSSPLSLSAAQCLSSCVCVCGEYMRANTTASALFWCSTTTVAGQSGPRMN